MFLFSGLFILFGGFFGQLPFLFAAFWIKKKCHVLHFGAKISRLHAVFAPFWTLMA
jgi:hypothetical protein